MYNISKGVFYIVLASLFFSVMGVFVKLIDVKASLFMELFCRFFANLIFLIPVMVKDFRGLIKVEKPSPLVLRNIFGIISIACTFYALRHLPVTNAVLLYNTSALFVPLIVWVLFKIKTTVGVLVGSIIGFCGIAFVLRPGLGIIDINSGIGLASGFFGAIVIVLIREVSKAITPSQILFYYSLTGVFVFGLFIPFEAFENYIFSTWIFLIAVGIFGALFQLFLTHSLAYAPVRLMSALIYLTILFSSFFDWMFWKKIPSIMEWIGISLVIFGGLISIYLGKNLKKPTKV